MIILTTRFSIFLNSLYIFGRCCDYFLYSLYIMKKLLTIGIIVATIVASLSFIDQEPLYKNLKVLPRNTTKVQMDSIMKHFAKSLGVKCNFCHVKGDDGKRLNFPSDENKHKGIARSMIKMTGKINKKFFKNPGEEIPEVTCFTCHNGNKHPGKLPPMDDEEE